MYVYSTLSDCMLIGFGALWEPHYYYYSWMKQDTFNGRVNSCRPHWERPEIRYIRVSYIRGLLYYYVNTHHLRYDRTPYNERSDQPVCRAWLWRGCKCDPQVTTDHTSSQVQSSNRPRLSAPVTTRYTVIYSIYLYITVLMQDRWVTMTMTLSSDFKKNQNVGSMENVTSFTWFFRVFVKMFFS